MFTGFVRDLTEQKRQQEAQLAAEAKFRRLVEQSITGIYVIQDDKFAYVNPKMAEIFGVHTRGADFQAVGRFRFRRGPSVGV